jgi:hypothetical protein
MTEVATSPMCRFVTSVMPSGGSIPQRSRAQAREQA